MNGNARRLVRGRQGGVAVEVGITLPVLALLLLGVLEWGWAFPRHVALEHIARDACRTGSLTQKEDASAAAVTRAQERLAEERFDVVDVDINIVAGSAPTAGNTLTVELAAPYRALFGAVPTPLHLRASATMRMEDQ